MKNRLPGISLLIATQNTAGTIELCLRSFQEFADEIIAVDNGSTDRTIEIVRSLEKEIPHMRFFSVPQLKDLYENRQYAFERSRYQWVARLDGDYVAYTDGPHDIKNLRKRVLNTRPGLWPVCFDTMQVNLAYDFRHTGKERKKKERNYVMPPVLHLSARIIQAFPGLRFIRRGRWEMCRHQIFLRHIRLEQPFWFHCEFKTDMDYLFRSERTNWRENGDFKRYPTLESYVREKARSRYQTDDLYEASRLYMEKSFKPLLRPYHPEDHYPYPQMIRHRMRLFGKPDGGEIPSSSQDDKSRPIKPDN